MEGAFLDFVEEMVFHQLLEDHRNVLAMFAQVPGVYRDVIDVHQDKAVEVCPKNLIHEVLEYRGGVDQAHNITQHSLCPVECTSSQMQSSPVLEVGWLRSTSTSLFLPLGNSNGSPSRPPFLRNVF